MPDGSWPSTAMPQGNGQMKDKQTTLSDKLIALYDRKNWRSAEQTAARLGGVGVATVHKWIKEGSLRAMDCGTENKPHYRIHVSWIEEKAAEMELAAREKDDE